MHSLTSKNTPSRYILQNVTHCCVRCRRLKTTRNSTAYLNFKTATDVLTFKSRFDDHAFADERGAQHACSVEYAPFQRIPKGRVKRDPREGTIEKGQSMSFCNDVAICITHRLYFLCSCV